MAAMGHGYGSEYHLLRWMGRHRCLLNQKIQAQINGPPQPIKWLDHPFGSNSRQPDAEWKGMDFLRDNQPLQSAWRDFWPVGRGIHNWDAVGWRGEGPGRELILAKAKAHLGELTSDCGATSETSVTKIQRAFAACTSPMTATG